ncbi:unnamed protein product [Phytomonas sp. EM1]|nr:unnamed protein product [Phytomonas sp. EM1]|eukprot:CCW61795.1 unnamed protein product [Phytomonas sp. isolate EM1]
MSYPPQQPPYSAYPPDQCPPQPPPKAPGYPPAVYPNQPPLCIGGYTQPQYYSPSPYPVDTSMQMPMPTLQNAFQAVDKDGSGFIDVNELNQALSSAGTTFSLATTEKLLNMFSGERPGALSFGEFEGLYAFVQVMFARFVQRDKSKEGRLDGNEIRMALIEGGYPLSEDTFQALMRKFDRSRSGSLGFDDYIELSIYISKVRSVFMFYDRQRTGEVVFNFDTFVAGSLSTL